MIAILVSGFSMRFGENKTVNIYPNIMLHMQLPD